MLPFLLILPLILGTTSSRPRRAPCPRSTLQSLTTAYITAQTTGTLTPLTTANFTLPPTSAGSYHENFRPTSPSTGILSTPLKIDHAKSYHDTTSCATYTELIITDPTHPYVLGTQIYLAADGTTIAKVDTLVTDAGDWLFNATGTLRWARSEDWGVIPEAARDTREVIQAAADAYLDVFSDKSVQVPWGYPCARLEGGSYTGRGGEGDRCDVGIPSGVELVERRYVIDETVGAVGVFLRFGGERGLPDSHEFRVEGGRVRFVHTLTVMG
ncbi:hypothetical protein BJ508DRAFT_210985 [Ascobolus immersus RN42]|uniref:DUF8021 domain-containing protein n=1 Tax=Ascobolus immersus RN42 TaxID=1160509 RepID=A0A3N4I4Q7_ASCIM|nr:hypothetical protein BJ508DRAFT_210985 [Ascobolus immersus RN42]